MPPTGFKRSRAIWDHARRPHTSRVDQWRSLMAAIAYELQPVRQWPMPRLRLAPLRQWLVASAPNLTRFSYNLLRSLTKRQAVIAAAIIAYYFVVRWVHSVLDAGPLVLIVTALVGIFTFGLSDEERQGLSAYSVFNRGFERLLGDIDADALLAQHVGGGMFMGGGLPDDEPAPRAVARPAARAPIVQENNDDESSDDEADRPQANRRRTGKKARRRDLEQRREIQRQRQAAAALGFDGENDAAAMLQLLE